jgi:glutathione peroxidase
VADARHSPTLYDFSAESITGDIVPLRRFQQRVLLVVNVASRCGYTPQYAGLERLYRAYARRGFFVLGFPCNQFGRQEPGREEEIRSFCASTYGVTFPLFAKIHVNGAGTHPLYVYLKSARKGWLGFERISWNFTKFLVDRNGRVVDRFGPATRPEQVEPAVMQLLDADESQEWTTAPPEF